MQSPTFLLDGQFNYSYGAIVSDPTGLASTRNSPDIKLNLPFPVTLDRVPTLSPGYNGVSSYGPYRDYNRN